MKKKPEIVAIVLIVLIAAFAILGICLGSVRITTSDILQSLFRSAANRTIGRNTVYIIRNLRLPRVISAILCGAALALCGLVFQSVFRNPMADSYILGVSSGASFAVGLAFITGISFADFSLPMVAFLGAMGTTALLFVISKRNTSSMLLSGIALNYLLSALTTLTIYITNRQAESILFWTMGSLGNSSWQKVWTIAAVLFVATIITYRYCNAMDLLLMDDSTAISSGLDVKTTRIVLLAISSIVTATVVSFCGIIGFVGLMSPHFMRILVGPKHKRLLPLSMMMGSAIMLFSDIISRFIIAPAELPIGIVTSILGAPVFLVLLRRKARGK